MKNGLLWISVLLLAVGLPARAQSPMPVPADIPPVPEDQAQVVFMKPTTSLAGGMPLAIFRLDGARPEMLGVLNKESRLVVSVAPGRHRFMSAVVMAVGKPLPHLLEAELEPGKRYFVLARLIYGKGFQLRPIRPGTVSDYDAGQPEFALWLAGTTQQDVPEKQIEWYTRREAKLIKAREIAERNWQAKTDAERAELTLNPQDAL
jgi:hypothetical protein